MKKINKFIKLKDGRIKLILENKQELVTYEDILFKYDLLISKKLDDDILEKIKVDNYETEGYYVALKYLKTRIRSISEMNNYLTNKGYSLSLVDKIINRLIKEGYLNDQNFVKAYIADKINFTNDGPIKIIRNLESLKIDSHLIEEEISVFSQSLIKEKIVKYIDKMMKASHHKSKYVLKNKILLNLISLGYEKEEIVPFLKKLDDMDEGDAYQKEYEKNYQKLSKKYSGKELEYRLKQKMYQKGFVNYINN